MGFSRQEYWSGVPLSSPSVLSRTPVIEQIVTGWTILKTCLSHLERKHVSVLTSIETQFLHEKPSLLTCTATGRLRGWLITLKTGSSFKGYLSKKRYV